ncbi:hypothetical protein KZZ52_15850 [Dactylosporangium sp. AC04546]|uniref:hypothetical protein n=1 Tax=Dactylosporangium sp. AC04546 TaxID=2862460 RepID=UPI001EDED751|nr:hypothetical protein [Dactylosporangium sp. AC04546]WVK86776.1 hypothetical protein KZZ52_15850 [Dactylosporangium sp. AC04546]
MARDVLDLGVARWHDGGRTAALEAWRLAGTAAPQTGNAVWQEIALRLTQPQPEDAWGW